MGIKDTENTESDKVSVNSVSLWLIVGTSGFVELAKSLWETQELWVYLLNLESSHFSINLIM